MYACEWVCDKVENSVLMGVWCRQGSYIIISLPGFGFGWKDR